VDYDITPLPDDADTEVTHAHIIKRLDQLEAKLEPIIDTWQDVAALSRSGRIVGRFIIWTGGVVVASLAIWNLIGGKWE
jgi:tetrahydromethanopterin S-methyltransferase subunit G